MCRFWYNLETNPVTKYSNSAPRYPTSICRIVGKFETIGSVVDQPTPVCRRNARSAENIAAVRESVNDDPNLSIPRRAQELELSQTSTWRILSKNLDLFPCKIQLIQELRSNNDLQRRQIANWTLEQLKIDLDLGKKQSSLATKLILGERVSRTSNIIAFRVSVTRKRFNSVLYTSKKLLSGVDLGLTALSDLISFKMKQKLH